MKQAAILATECHFPAGLLANEQLAAEFTGWSAEKIEGKTGICQRHIAAESECSSDLAVAAANKLFASGICRAEEIDYLILCTQTPDYFLPTTACLIQERLGVPISAGAIDFNQGCSGFVYGLGLAKGLIETGQAQKVLLLTAETYSKLLHPGDRSVRTIFGDAAAATLVGGVEPPNGDGQAWIGPFVFGTDGRGAENLIVPNGGMRNRRVGNGEAVPDEQGNLRTRDNLYMNGPEIFNFTLRVVPPCLQELLRRSGVSAEQVDLFVFHQANQYMLEHLRKKLKIPQEKFLLALRDCGNTVSSTIPIALRCAAGNGQLKRGHQLALLGFGVGFSWAGTMIRWFPND